MLTLLSVQAINFEPLSDLGAALAQTFLRCLYFLWQVQQICNGWHVGYTCNYSHRRCCVLQKLQTLHISRKSNAYSSKYASNHIVPMSIMELYLTPPYVLMVCCLIKHGDFSFTIRAIYGISIVFFQFSHEILISIRI
jgi:hypothetical protein